MRDLIVMAILFGGALIALRRPWIGVMLWTCVSLMNPHQEFGFATKEMPVAMAVAVCTLIGLVGTKERQSPFLGAPVTLLLLFSLWTCVTLPFSIYLEPSLPLWVRSMKIYFMIFISLALIDNKRKLHIFVLVVVVSLGFYGVKGGVFTLLTGGSYRVWGPPNTFVEGNNELAMALVMIIPLMRYLQTRAQGKWESRAWLGSMLITSLTVLGSHSRGALLALGAMAVILWLKNDRKFIGFIILVGAGTAMLFFMPEEWWSRMNTIQTYQADDSALGRINAWNMAWTLAKDRWFGGGFMIYRSEVFLMYSPEPWRVHAAHSIYFQVLGEHGFIGLFLFLAMGFSVWWSAGRLAKEAKGDPEGKWAADLGAMVQVGLVGYAVGGAFLSLAYFDLPYNMLMFVVLARHTYHRDRAKQSGKAAGSVDTEPKPVRVNASSLGSRPN